MSGFRSFLVPMGFAPPRMLADFFLNHMPAAADAARAEVRVWASLQPGHIGLCTNAFFHTNRGHRNVLFINSFRIPSIVFTIKKNAEFSPPSSLRCCFSCLSCRPSVFSCSYALLPAHFCVVLAHAICVGAASSADLPGKHAKQVVRHATRQSQRNSSAEDERDAIFLQIRLYVCTF